VASPLLHRHSRARRLSAVKLRNSAKRRANGVAPVLPRKIDSATPRKRAQKVVRQLQISCRHTVFSAKLVDLCMNLIEHAPSLGKAFVMSSGKLARVPK